MRFYRLSMKHKIRILFFAFSTVLMGLLMVFVQSHIPTTHPEKQTLSKSKIMTAPLDGATQLTLSESYGKLPLTFEKNKGQADPQVKFISKGSGYTLFLTDKEAVLVLNKHRVKSDKAGKVDGKNLQTTTVMRLKLVGANERPRFESAEKTEGISNYFIGNDPKKWHSNVPQYAKVKMKNVYPGIDMVYYGNQRKLEYDFVVSPGADPKNICLKWDGAKSAKVDGEGNLVLKAKGGQVVFKAPVIYQVKNGEREPLSGSYAMAGNNQIVFEVQNYDLTQPLVIDPQLDYSTYLGGNNNDTCYGMVVDSSGNAYVTGYTLSSTFPTQSAYQSTLVGSTDDFVTKLNPAGNGLVNSTYLGSTCTTEGEGIAVDSSGNAYVTGYTNSTTFPTLNGFQTSLTDSIGAFVTKFSSTGTLAYSTYLGGTTTGFSSQAMGIAVDSSQNAYLVGFTSSTTFPTTAGAYQTALS